MMPSNRKHALILNQFVYFKHILWIFAGLVCFVLTIYPALADYVLPPVVERYIVLADSWKLLRSSDGNDCVEVSRASKKYVWTIDKFMLADRTVSDSICTGTWKTFTRGYLDDLNKLPPHTALELELVNNKAAAPLVVAGLWPVDFAQKWQKACIYGSRVLELPPDKVKAIGSPTNYKRKIIECSDQQWLKLSKRATTTK